MLTLIILKQQQITQLSEEVKSLKSLNQTPNNDIEVIEKVHVNEDTKKDSLVKEVSDESYKCDVCEYKCKSEITLIKHTNTKHPTQNTENINEAKFFCHECNTSYKTKKSFKKHNETIHNAMKPYICETCGEKFQDKNKHEDHQKHHKQDISIKH